jgi:serine/threonine protein kinase
MYSMSISQSHPPDTQQYCIRCSIALPPTAAFCGNCGERVGKTDQITTDVSSIDRHVDIERYRIHSLIQRTTYTQLYLAVDTQQKRPVVIRDIDLQQLDISSRACVFKAVEQENDLLHRENCNDVLSLIASFCTQNHLYSVSAWPLTTSPQNGKHRQASHIYTLQDLLQSGIGLPDEQTASYWTLRLAYTVERLHKMNIVIGTLDPSTILVSQKDYNGHPALFPSWTPSAVRSQFTQTLKNANLSPIPYITTDRTTFFSPEAKQDLPEIRSDVYSLGAILYLLVTGIAPAEQNIAVSQQLRSRRVINTRVENTLAQIILKTLEKEPAARFQSVSEFIAVLLQQQEQSKIAKRLYQQQGQINVARRLYHTLLDRSRSAEKVGTQLAVINFTSDKDNNKTEQGKAALANMGINDDTISIAPMQKQLARDYLSHIDASKLGQKQLNSDNEELAMKDGYSEQIMQLIRKEIKSAKSEITATVLEAVAGSDAERTLETKSDNTVSSSEEIQNMDSRQLPDKTDTEDVPSSQTSATDDEQLPNNTLAFSSESPALPPAEDVPSSQISATDDEQLPNGTLVVSSESLATLPAEDTPSSQATVTDAEQLLDDILAFSSESLASPPAEDAPNSQSSATDDEQLPNGTLVASPESLATPPAEDAPGSLATVTDAEQLLDDTLAFSSESLVSPPAEDAPGSQTSATDAEQLSEGTLAASSESLEQIPIIEESQQNASANAVPPDIENRSSSDSNNTASRLPALLPSEALQQGRREPTALTKLFSSLLERVKRFLLGGQPCTNNAVAMIETPMRIQPNKNYTIRIHIIGRNEPKHVPAFKPSNEATRVGGLGSLIHGEIVHIEVRAALYHNYAYIVQQTDVEVPASNYAAEITIPMRSITDSSGTKRERLHIFFTDEKHNPLYEKPFLIELFISNLVQSGHEGHNVLTIPL